MNIFDIFDIFDIYQISDPTIYSKIQNFPNRQDNGQETFDVYQTSNDSKTRGTASRVRLCVDELFSSPGMKLPR